MDPNEVPDAVAPEIEIEPEAAIYWQWYFSLSNSLRRVRDGYCEPFPPSEFLAWSQATGTIVYPQEYAILRAMDDAFREEMNKELADYRERLREKQKAEVEAAKAKGGRR